MSTAANCVPSDCRIATVRADGRPHVAPVWFVLDGEDLIFMTGAGTAKGKALRRDPRVALAVDLEEPPYAFVLVEGTVEGAVMAKSKKRISARKSSNRRKDSANPARSKSTKHAMSKKAKSKVRRAGMRAKKAASKKKPPPKTLKPAEA